MTVLATRIIVFPNFFSDLVDEDMKQGERIMMAKQKALERKAETVPKGTFLHIFEAINAI